MLYLLRYLQQFKKFSLIHYFQIFNFIITNLILFKNKYFLIFIRFLYYLSKKFVNIYDRNY